MESLMKSLYVGIDIGTSGCRVFIIDEDEQVVTHSSAPLPSSVFRNNHTIQSPIDWWECCQQVLTEALSNVDKSQIKALTIDGTSGTVLLTNSDGGVLSDAYMYNDNSNNEQSLLIKQFAPKENGAHGSSSGLAKCLSLVSKYGNNESSVCLNQADWIAGNFLNRYNFSDENNALKMGYDVIHRVWPKWINKVINPKYLPQNIYQPGKVIGQICDTIATHFGLPQTVKIVAGTTDSIAAFIATGASNIGDAVTSLGSTLAIKLISTKPVYAPEYGVYSHRLGDMWLAGGASNSGGAVLKKIFDQKQLDSMTNLLNPKKLTGLDYYPLLKKGERFPINDSELEPKLAPRPKNDVEFFQGILEGIARIERQAYSRLEEFGAGYPKRIISMGSGSKNIPWRVIREQYCGVNISTSSNSEAAYGSALLAKQSLACSIRQ